MGGISAFLTERKYDDLLGRHGQYVRWLKARTCTCIDKGSVDPKCMKCQGRGKIYSFQLYFDYVHENSKHNRTTVAPANLPLYNVDEVTRHDYPYEIVEFDSTYIVIKQKDPLRRLPKPHQKISVNYTQKRLYSETLTTIAHLNDNMIQLDELVLTAKRDDRVQLKFPVDLFKIIEVKDTTDDIVLSVEDFYRDIIVIEAEQKEFDIFAVDTGTKKFTVTGKSTPYIVIGNTIEVIGSMGNDGEYTVVSTIYDSVNDKTEIEVSEVIPDAATDGKVKAPAYVVNQSHNFSVQVEYVPPFKFILSGISEKMKYEDAYLTEAGEGQLVVPYNHLIGDGDLITALSAERRSENLLKYKVGQLDYELTAFHVSKIIKIEDEDGNSNFVAGTDYVLFDYDKVRFLSGGNKPSGKFNVSYLFHPTYSILDDVPMIRTGENKRFPRKVMLKLFKKFNVEHDVRKTTKWNF